MIKAHIMSAVRKLKNRSYTRDLANFCDYFVLKETSDAAHAKSPGRGPFKIPLIVQRRLATRRLYAYHWITHSLQIPYSMTRGIPSISPTMPDPIACFMSILKTTLPDAPKRRVPFAINPPLSKTLGAVIVGISPDTPESHRKFKEKYHLNFTLLADTDRTVIEQLGAWGEKTSYGVKKLGVIRSTFLFDGNGILVKVWPKVSPNTHGEEIAAFLLSGK